GWQEPAVSIPGRSSPARRIWFALAVAAVGLLVAGTIGVRSVKETAEELGTARSGPEPIGVSADHWILSIYAGDGQAGHVNGAAAAARFNGPFGLAVDPSGTLYVADTGNQRIRTVTNSGLVLDIAGSGQEGME